MKEAYISLFYFYFLVTVPLEESYEEWLITEGPQHIRRIAEHYGVFQHLFGDAYYYPVTPMKIAFKNSDSEYTPVYYGNTIKPKEVGIKLLTLKVREFLPQLKTKRTDSF